MSEDPIPVCVHCGAELVRVNGHVACTRSIYHHQPPNGPGHNDNRLGVIKTAKGPNVYGGLESKLKAWQKRNLVIETVETTSDDGRRLINTVIRSNAPQRKLKAAEAQTKRVATRRKTADERYYYQKYCSLMEVNHIPPRPFEAWLENYRACQSRQTQAV